MTAVDLGFPRVPGTRGSSRVPRPENPRLVDTFGRVATDLRVSLTDRCNLRCTYCMPAEGLDWLPRGELLTDDELVRLVRIAVAAARRRGAPLHRRRAAAAARASSTSSRRPRRCARGPTMSLTTNGDRAGRARPALLAAGLDRRQRLAGHPATRSAFATHHPPRPARRRARRARRRPRRRASARSRSTRC